jgi:hypothetical protein
MARDKDPSAIHLNEHRRMGPVAGLLYNLNGSTALRPQPVKTHHIPAKRLSHVVHLASFL